MGIPLQQREVAHGRSDDVGRRWRWSARPRHQRTGPRPAGPRHPVRAAWQRNRGGVGFDVPRHIPLPTLKWATPGPVTARSPLSLSGWPVGQLDRPEWLHGRELRTELPADQLPEFARAWRRSSLVCAGFFAPVPPSGHCANGSDCYGEKRHSQAQRSSRIAGWTLMAMGSSISSLHRARRLVRSPARASGSPRPVEPPLFGTFPPCPTTPFTADSSGPYTCATACTPGLSTRITATGALVSRRRERRGPTRLCTNPFRSRRPPGTPRSPPRWSGRRRAWWILMATAISTPSTRDPNDANFGPCFATITLASSTSAGVRVLFPKAPGDRSTRMTFAPFASSPIVQTAGLIDLNGDGLPDQWAGAGTTANVELNDGVQFLTNGIGEVTAAVRPGTDTVPIYTPCPQRSLCLIGKPCVYCFVSTGTRSDTGRILDVDGDGRVDVRAGNSRCLADIASHLLQPRRPVRERRPASPWLGTRIRI